MQPFAQVHSGEMFLTYAADEADAREVFTDHGLPAKGNVRKQRARPASANKYTRDGETVAATVIGEIPAQYQDADPAEDTLVDGDIEAPDVLNA